jgi:hypothetical protein
MAYDGVQWQARVNTVISPLVQQNAEIRRRLSDYYLTNRKSAPSIQVGLSLRNTQTYYRLLNGGEGDTNASSCILSKNTPGKQIRGQVTFHLNTTT